MHSGLAKWIWFYFLSCYICDVCSSLHVSALYRNYTALKGVMEGDIVFAGLFPIHSPGTWNNICGGRLSVERGIHRLEAMFYAIDEINRDTSILPHITIGAEVHDTCSHDTVALEGAVTSVVDRVNRGSTRCPGDVSKHKMVAGVIGAAMSSISAQVANLLRLFQFPQISYASTSADLSDRKRYNYFLRTVPSDTEQVDAMLSVVKHFKWRSVYIIYSAGSYGETAFEMFSREADKLDVCVVESIRLNRESDYDAVVRQLLRHDTTRVVVLFCQNYFTTKLLSAVASLAPRNRFQWLASDSWGTRVEFMEDALLRDVADGAITFTLKTRTMPSFVDYFRKLRPAENKRNPWFIEYWQDLHHCQFENSDAATPFEDPCPAYGEYPTQFYIDDKVPYVVDAVRALAYALDDVYKKCCPLQEGICKNLTLVGGDVLLETLKNITFPGVFGPTKFNADGNAPHGYEIMLLRHGNYGRIGSWNGSLHMKALDTVLPYSYCSALCSMGSVRVPKKHSPACCYSCSECSSNEYVDESGRCASCGNGFRPNKTRDGCENLPVRYLSRTWVILVATPAGVGIVITSIIVLVFIYNNNTTIVKASARELTYPLLAGVLLAYSLTFIMVADPNPTLCGIRRFGIGFSFCLCYSALLTKTNRLARIFMFKEQEMVKRAPRFITPQSQIVIMFGIVFVHMVMLVVGLYLDPPRIEPAAPTSESTESILFICVVPYYDIIVTYSYNLLLVFICTVYAFRTRKVPTNFNEAKYLGFVMYTTCVIWVAFIPVYTIGISDDYAIVAVCLNVTLSATSIIAGVFCPKMYIIVFRPARNQRSGTTRSMQYNSQSVDGGDEKGAPGRKMTVASTSTAMSIMAASTRLGSFDEEFQFQNLPVSKSKVQPL